MNRVHLIDCMEFMKQLPDKHYDLAIVDPPYGIGNWIKVTGNTNGGALTHGSVNWNNESDRPNDEYFIELRRISRERIIWGANYFNCFENGNGAIVWDKKNRNPKFSNVEIASYSKHKRVGIIELGFQGFNKDPSALFHPCAKPVQLYKELLDLYAKPGQTIFDSHVGSGSIRIACHDMGYDFTGCEIDPDYHAAQEKRFQTHIAQNQLFEPAELTAQYAQGDLL